MKLGKHILVAPLNWGLGHATRCIPIINALIARGHMVTIASDGQSLDLLIKEFPHLKTVKLPGYNVQYSRNTKDFKRTLLLQTGHIRKAIKAEHKLLQNFVTDLKLDAVISDSRFGMYSDKIPSIIISHQLTVLSGSTTKISSYIHRHYINKFTECWIPDYENENNLSGILGHPSRILDHGKYIGPLSRMEKKEVPQKYDLTAILSGPEPQRTLLEQILLCQLKKYNGKVLLVQGIVGEEEERRKIGNIEIVNFLTTPDLEKVINQSAFIISRPGYTTVMDLAAMGKKALFIPTPGQPEQEYLARYLKEKRIAPFVRQDDFKVKNLSTLSIYKGFTSQEKTSNFSDFFSLFEGEGKFGAYSKLTFNINFLLVRLNDMLNNREPQT